jgi:23S rRNA pseudouridine2605 synthase
MEPLNLVHALCRLGVCSHSEARLLVATGRVRLNGSVATDPDEQVDLVRARIDVDGLGRLPRPTYLVMNKPAGVSTSPGGDSRRSVCDLLPDDLPRVAPVGGLERDTEGLLLLTNDVEWAVRMRHPWVERVYHVLVDGELDTDLVTSIAAGGRPGRDGSLRLTRVRSMSRAGPGWLEVVVSDGWNREMRDMLESAGLRVVRMIRDAIGPLALGTLGTGGVRVLTWAEKQQLDARVAGRGSPSSGARPGQA